MTNEQIKKLQSENYTLKKFIGLKDEEIKRQIERRKKAVLRRDIIIVSLIIINLLLWLF